MRSNRPVPRRVPAAAICRSTTTHWSTPSRSSSATPPAHATSRSRPRGPRPQENYPLRTRSPSHLTCGGRSASSMRPANRRPPAATIRSRLPATAQAARTTMRQPSAAMRWAGRTETPRPGAPSRAACWTRGAGPCARTWAPTTAGRPTPIPAPGASPAVCSRAAAPAAAAAAAAGRQQQHGAGQPTGVRRQLRRL